MKKLAGVFEWRQFHCQTQTTHALKHTKGNTMKALLVAVALINAPTDQQEMMVYDLYKTDPVLAADVLDVASEVGKSRQQLQELEIEGYINNLQELEIEGYINNLKELETPKGASIKAPVNGLMF